METPIITVGNKLVRSVSNAVETNEALKKVNISELHPDVVRLIACQFEGIKGLVELATGQVKTISYLSEMNKKLGTVSINLTAALKQKKQYGNGLRRRLD